METNTNNLFYLNNLANKYKIVLKDSINSTQLYIFSANNSSFTDLVLWALDDPTKTPEFVNNLSQNSNLGNNQIIYLNNLYNRGSSIDNYNKILYDSNISNQVLIFSQSISSFVNLLNWSLNNPFKNVPSVQDALFGTIDISFCSGPDGYNNNTVGILLDLSGNQLPIDNSGITYSNKGDIDADVMLYTRNTNEIYVRCKADSSYNGYYLYSTIFNISRTDPSTNSTQIFDSSRNSDISNAYLTTSTKTSDLSGDSFISTSDVYNPVSNYELKFSGLDSSYNFFVREKYFFIQADARCLSGNLYESCLINLSTTPQRIGVISLA